MTTSVEKNALLALISTGLAAMMAGVDFSIVNTTLPSIQQSLAMPVSQLQWLMAGFGITFCSLLVAVGRFADIVGRRKILYISLIGFALSSLAAGLAANGSILIFMRFMQGIFGAGIFPTGMAIVANAYSDKNRSQALAIYMSLLGVGLAFGPVLGGILSTWLGWRWIFFINIPVVATSMAICFISVQESSLPNAPAIDWWGVALSIIFLSALTFAINEGGFWGWSSSLILSCFIIALISLIVLILIENSIVNPLIDFSLLKNDSFMAALLLFIATVGFCWPVIFLMPLYLHSILGFGAASTGSILLLMTGMTFVAPMLGNYWYQRKSKLQAFHGTLLIEAIAILLFCYLGLGGPMWLLVISFIMFGFSWGVGNGIPLPLSLLHLPNTNDVGFVSGTLMTLMNICGLISLTVVTTVYRHSETTALMQRLQLHKIILTPEQRNQVQLLLSDPEHATEYLSYFSHQAASQIVSFFHQSFIIGMHDAYFLLLLVTVIIWVIAAFLMRRVIKEENSL